MKKVHIKPGYYWAVIAVFAVALLSLAAVHVCTDADDEEQPLMLLGDANPSGTCGTDLTWSLNTTTGELTISGTGTTMSNFNQDNKAGWSNYGSSIKKITIAAPNLTNIGERAFYNYAGINYEFESIDFGNVTTIGTFAFYECGIVRLDVPDTVTATGLCLFNPDKLEYIYISSALTNYSTLAFVMPSEARPVAFLDSDGKTEIYRYASVTATLTADVLNLRGNVFYKAENITVQGNGSTGYAFVKGVDIGNAAAPGTVRYYYDGSVLNIASFRSDNADMKEFNSSDPAPWSTDITNMKVGRGVRSISSYAFSGCTKLATVELSDTLYSIGVESFKGCSSLKTIDLRNVGNIRTGAFSGCTSLEEVIMTNCTGTISSNVFAGCTGLKMIAFGTGLGFINSNAFPSDLVFYDVDGVTVIEKDVNGLKGKTFYLLEGKMRRSIPTGEAFWVINGTELYVFGSGAMGDNLVNDAPAWGTKLTKAVIAEGVTKVGTYSFAKQEKLMAVVLPSTLLTISSGAFSGCIALKSVTIPESVGVIEEDAFVNCASITAFAVSGSNASFAAVDGAILNKGKTEVILYPAGKEGIYKAPSTVNTIGPNAFSGSKVTTVVMSNVTKIGKHAFSDCNSLIAVVFGSGLKEVDLTAAGGSFSCAFFDVNGSALKKSIDNLAGRTFIGGYDGKGVSLYYAGTSINSYTVTVESSVASVAVPAYRIAAIKEFSEDLSLKINFGGYTVELDPKALGQVSGDLVLTGSDSAILSNAARNAVNGRPVYTINAGSLTDLGGGEAIISVPYECKTDNEHEKIYVVCVRSDGSVEKMQLTEVAGDYVEFSTTHFSDFAVMMQYVVSIKGEGVTVKSGETVLSDGAKVDCGTVLTISIADKDRKVGGISVDVGAVENGMYTVTSDVTITGSYEARQYTVTILGEGITVMNGGTEVKSGDKVDVGTVLKVTMEGKSGHRSNIESSVGTLENGNHTVESDVTFTGSYTKEKDDDNTALIAGVAIVVVVLVILGLVLFVKPGILKKH